MENSNPRSLEKTKTNDRSFYGRNISSEYKQRAFHKDKSISRKNKKEVDRFINSRIAKSGIRERRVSKYYSSFRRILTLASNDFDLKAAGEEEFDKVLRAINESSLSNETKCDFRKYLKCYLRSRNGGELPKWAKEIKSRVGEMKVMLPEDIPEAEEIEKLISVCSNERDRCLIKFLSESGLRAGELGSLQIKHFRFLEAGCQVTVPLTDTTKTGARTLLVIESEGHVKSWLNAHPWRDNPNAPMWVLVEQNEGEMVSMTYDGMRRMVYNKAVKAKLDPSKFNLHNFRHFAATEKAKWMTDQQMMDYFGWRKSDMVRRYTHLSGRDMNVAILSHYGIKKGDEEERPICPRCGLQNMSGAKWCSRCRIPLDLKTAVEANKRNDTYNEVMNRFIEKVKDDPAIRKILIETVKEVKGNNMV